MSANFDATLTRGDREPVHPMSQLLCAWSGVLSMVIWTVGFLAIAGFVPPPSPAASAAEIHAFYTENQFSILLGMAVTIFGSVFIAPFASVVTVQMRRIEGRHSPLAYTYLAMKTLSIMAFVYTCFMFMTAAFRTDNPPEVTRILNDIGWIPFVGSFQIVFLAVLCFALCILMNRDQQVYPRWLGYFSLFETVAQFAGSLVPFFKTGPFAWDGIVAFNIAVTLYVTWFVVVTWQTVKAIKRQAKVAIEP